VKRSPELAPLSRHHHVALEVALRLRRATDESLDDAVARYLTFSAGDGEEHFAEEEALLLPELRPDLGRRMRDEHAAIRDATRALEARPDRGAAHRLGELLTAHVRFEEREVFPELERSLPADRLAEIGRRLAA
jgi:hypothetical protein